jgi:alkanesulfonate monooxygenase SsuD/methylene tetrahydromethanopterin reductase-like flavin-dependent oxidoreductase (luciferase family)
MLAIAAREADIVGILPGPLNAGEPTVNDPVAYAPERYAQKIALLREAAGERFSQLELSVITTPVFTDNRRQGAELAAQRRGWSGVSVEEILEVPTIFIGTVEQIAEQMLERRERFGISYYMIFDSHMEASAPLVERLSGR